MSPLLTLLTLPPSGPRYYNHYQQFSCHQLETRARLWHTDIEGTYSKIDIVPAMFLSFRSPSPTPPPFADDSFENLSLTRDYFKKF